MATAARSHGLGGGVASMPPAAPPWPLPAVPDSDRPADRDDDRPIDRSADGDSCTSSGRDVIRSDVIVIGAGIAGLTAAALLAQEGLRVLLLEAHSQSGGCAGSFRRGPYRFDVGATQVAGLEPGGIHWRLWRHFGLPLPPASSLDPGCSVQLAGRRSRSSSGAIRSAGARSACASSPAVAASGPSVPPCTTATGPSLPVTRCCRPAPPGTWSGCWRLYAPPPWPAAFSPPPPWRTCSGSPAAAAMGACAASSISS